MSISVKQSTMEPWLATSTGPEMARRRTARLICLLLHSATLLGRLSYLRLGYRVQLITQYSYVNYILSLNYERSYSETP